MKKYASRSLKWILLCLIFFAILLSAAVLMLVLNLVSAAVSVPLTIAAGAFCILFFTIFLAEKSRYLTIDERQIILPRGATLNGKTTFSRTTIRFDNVRTFDCKYVKGTPGALARMITLLGGTAAKGTVFYTFKLVNGNSVAFTLYAFGKDAEKETVSTIERVLNQTTKHI